MPEGPQKDFKDVPIPTLNDLVQLSIGRFRSQELINRRTKPPEDLVPYSPSMGIEALFAKNVPRVVSRIHSVKDYKNNFLHSPHVGVGK